jgi:NAD(P)-dependent dehydrogenase (short-subunit alcohol dehydrogenase family)
MITADLTARTALVTGGASGIGLATVRRLAACGARVAINDLANNPKLADAEAQLKREGFDVIAVPGSVGNPDEANAAVDTTIQRFGRLDYLVNNAGTSETAAPIPPQDLDRLGEDFWREILSVNLVGPFRCTRAAAPHLKAAHGAVVSWIEHGLRGLEGRSDEPHHQSRARAGARGSRQRGCAWHDPYAVDNPFRPGLGRPLGGNDLSQTGGNARRHCGSHFVPARRGRLRDRPDDTRGRWHGLIGGYA